MSNDMHVKVLVPAVTNTWVFIDFLKRIKPGSVTGLKIMERDLVLWRTQSGTVTLFSAYCPHLGGNLAFGKVRGEALECLYHKKHFSTTGICRGLAASAFSYPLQEKNGMLFAWIGDSSPSWEMPNFLLGSHQDPQSVWRIFRKTFYRFNFPPRYVGENSVDANHFKTFHKICTTYDPLEVVLKDDYRFISKLKTKNNQSKYLPQEIEVVVTSIGPCNSVVDSIIKLKKKAYQLKFIYLATPTQNSNTNFHVFMAVPMNEHEDNSLRQRILAYFYFHFAFISQTWEFRRESKTVFEPKSNLVNPVLNQQEDAIKEYYDWYQRFYLSSIEEGI